MRALGPWPAALVVALAASAMGPAGAQPVVPGYAVTVYSTLPGPVGLSFDAAGRLFVGSDVPGSSLITDQWVRRIPAGGGAPSDYGPFTIPDPRGVLVDGDGAFTDEPGSVIVSGSVDAASGQVVAILPSNSTPQPGAMLQVLHDAGAGGVASPTYVARDAGGLLIVDPAAKAILRLVPPGAPTPLITSAETPRFIAVDGSGTIFVSYDSVIRSYDATGAAVDDPLATGLAGPLPIAISPGGDFPPGLYAVEGDTGKLFEIASDGMRTEIGSGFPANLGEIEFDADGALYVASFTAGQVIRIGAPLPPPPPPPLGPFLCYNAKATPGTPKLANAEVAVIDAFETRDAKVGKPKAVCSPAVVSASDIPLPVANTGTSSLAGYESGWVPSSRHVPQTLAVTNALGTLTIQTLPAGADRILLRSGFHLSMEPPPLSNAGDPFQCYRARPAPGEAFASREVTVADPLGPGGTAGRSLALRKLTRLCLPAAYDGVSPGAPDDLLLCYAAKPAKGAARTTPRTGMHVTNLRAADQQLDMRKGATRKRVRKQTGRIAGDTLAPAADDGMTRPGEWDLDDNGGPRWSGGGPLGDGELLEASFGEDAAFPEGVVKRWRVFVEIDIVVNDTRDGPGVVVRSFGIPGIPDGTEIRAMAHGKPAGLGSRSAWFTAPDGTTLESLAGATQVFEANGDGSSDAFAFQITRFGIEYELAVTSGGSGTGVPEGELCLPSTAP